MLRPHTSRTLFPYTTLFRSSPAVASPRVPSSKKGCVALPVIEDKSPVTLRPVLVSFWPGVTATVRSVVLPAVTLDGVALPRSEEHTSELQSRGHLVCRLLLD